MTSTNNNNLTFFPAFYMIIFKLASKLKEFYREYLYTCHLDSAINILLYLSISFPIHRSALYFWT